MRLLTTLQSIPPPAQRRFRVWAAQEPALAALDFQAMRDLLLDDHEPIDHDRKDQLLAALIRLARTDHDAGTGLLVCLLPGIKAKLRDHARGLDPDEAASVLVAALWQRIRSYPLDRRPRKIALNLLLDAARDVIAARNAQKAWDNHAQLDDQDHDTEDTDPGYTPGLIWHLVRCAGVLTPREIILIDATRLRGLPLTDLARLLGIGHEAAKKARRRAELKLAAYWANSRDAV